MEARRLKFSGGLLGGYAGEPASTPAVPSQAQQGEGREYEGGRLGDCSAGGTAVDGDFVKHVFLNTAAMISAVKRELNVSR